MTVGSTIQIMIRDKLHNAEIVKRPFVKKNNKKADTVLYLLFCTLYTNNSNKNCIKGKN